jgi:hypothetical protein
LESPSSFSRGVPWAELGELSHNDHRALLAAGAAGEVNASKFQKEIMRGGLRYFRQSGMESQELTTSREAVLFGSDGKKTLLSSNTSYVAK